MLTYRYMFSYTSRSLKTALEIEFIRFCLVGGTGFMINFLILGGLHRLFGVPVPAAQFVGAEVALFSNFLLHHHWTYQKNKTEKSIFKLMIQFHATSWPAILGSTLMVSIGVKVFHLGELLSLAISSGIALSWNFGWSKYVIWRDVSSDSLQKLIK